MVGPDERPVRVETNSDWFDTVLVVALIVACFVIPLGLLGAIVYIVSFAWTAGTG